MSMIVKLLLNLIWARAQFGIGSTFQVEKTWKELKLTAGFFTSPLKKWFEVRIWQSSFAQINYILKKSSNHTLADSHGRSCDFSWLAKKKWHFSKLSGIYGSNTAINLEEEAENEEEQGASGVHCYKKLFFTFNGNLMETKCLYHWCFLTCIPHF